MTEALLPFGRQTVATMLVHRAEETPDDPFIIVEDETTVTTLDFAATLALAERGATVLSDLGVGRGDRFGVVLGNCVEFFACWFGAALTGAIMTPTNPDGTVDEIEHVLSHAKCRAVVTDPAQRDIVEKAGGSVLSGTVIVTGEDFDTRSSQPRAVRAEVAATDPLAILYTSGTTSRPKGVIVTHSNYLVAGEVIAQNIRMRPDDRWLVVLPLFHANAQYYSTMSSLVTGASLAVMQRFSASTWSQQAAKHDTTLASLFAAPIRMILAQPPAQHDRDNRLRATYFGQNLTLEQLATFEERFGCPLVQLYGMTETILPPLMNPLFGRRDSMTVGLPTTAARIRVVDDEDRDVNVGDTGQLLVGGVPGITLMGGYLDDPMATRSAMSDGWLRTGDVMRVEADGFLAFHDRAKDMIKRSGENVAAAEVERVVNGHPAVFESAVVGIPDAIRDEAIKVFVVLADGATVSEQTLIEFCAERLAKFKVPSAVEIIDELPRTSVGKIQKHLLRARPA